MKLWSMLLSAVALLCVSAMGYGAESSYGETISLFKNAGGSAAFFGHSYGYAVFPTVGEGGLVAGAAIGHGRVYAGAKLTGDTRMQQLSVGLQAGAKVYSQVIFFEDRRAYEKFTSGTFQFGAGASAIAATASANASASTSGQSAGASGADTAAGTVGKFQDGMAVFTIAKGGLMYAATIAGQRFTYKPRGTG